MTEAGSSIQQIRAYWDSHVHDFEVSKHEPGTPGFFADLEQYHFEKLHHLPRLIDFEGYRGGRVLDVGCGAGVDLSRFARGGARAFGVDLATSAVALARRNFEIQGLNAGFCMADGEALPFGSESFDLVFAHGVVQYTVDGQRLVDECRRVLRPGGLATFQVYNRRSWLNLLSKVMKVPLEHEDAPVLRKYTAAEFRALLRGFATVDVVFERFPVVSRLHGGWKGALYNRLFVGAFNTLPKAWVRQYGWHLLAFCRK